MAISKRTRDIVYNKYDGHCGYCGKEIAYKDMQVDHIFPRYLGGTDDVNNLLPSCRSCNFRKQTYSVGKFRDILRAQAKKEMDRFQAKQSADYKLIEYHDHPIVFYFEDDYSSTPVYNSLTKIKDMFESIDLDSLNRDELCRVSEVTEKMYTAVCKAIRQNSYKWK